VTVPYRQVRATYTDTTITVYQAYGPEIAEPALATGRFVAPFERDRMTWIKPSFRWMMYRCGFATKPGQERVLAVEITRAGFEWALANACLSHFDRDRYASREAWSELLHTSSVRVQWDPERSLAMAALPYRSVQVGLSAEAVARYVDEWTVAIQDATPVAGAVRAALAAGDAEGAAGLLPEERPYPLPEGIAAHVGADPG
jgi:hypothetical protein